MPTSSGVNYTNPKVSDVSGRSNIATGKNCYGKNSVTNNQSRLLTTGIIKRKQRTTPGKKWQCPHTRTSNTAGKDQFQVNQVQYKSQPWSKW